MARNMQPIAKRCKALNLSPAAMGYAKKNTNRNPKGQMRKKQSEYALQLTEKQKVKFVYGIMEKQFHMYYEKASRMPGKTGENLLTLIERRLDNVVYRLGFAMIPHKLSPFILLIMVPLYNLCTDIIQTTSLTMRLCSCRTDIPSMPYQPVAEITSFFWWNNLP